MMREDILLVEDRPDLVRDKHSKAIKNSDHESLIAYKKQRILRREQKKIPQRMDALEEKMNMIMEKLDRLLDD